MMFPWVPAASNPQRGMRTIEVVESDPTWPVQFETERARLASVLGEGVVAIHHIGSTAVPGLAAKPVIDLLVEVRDLAALDARSEALILCGYTPRGENGIPGRRYFHKGTPVRTHHLHAFAEGDGALVRHLAFRDYLRAHPETAREYGELKKGLARTWAHDPVRYVEGKDAYVKRIEARALASVALAVTKGVIPFNGSDRL